MLEKDLKPTRMQDTRLSSKHNLVEKESVLRPVYKSVVNWPDTVKQYMPSPGEETRLDEMRPAMKSKTIQGEGTQRQTMSDVRLMFAGLINTIVAIVVLVLV